MMVRREEDDHFQIRPSWPRSRCSHPSQLTPLFQTGILSQQQALLFLSQQQQDGWYAQVATSMFFFIASIFRRGTLERAPYHDGCGSAHPGPLDHHEH
jgi:hypothetical protein